MLEINLDEVYDIYNYYVCSKYYKTSAVKRMNFIEFIEGELQTILFIKYGSKANNYKII